MMSNYTDMLENILSFKKCYQVKN